ncbi:MAG: NAD(+) diphosphatase [Spirochaetes bacterium]|nr:NAD(+) diphosphatase [Spirochaetota bacterium]
MSDAGRLAGAPVLAFRGPELLLDEASGRPAPPPADARVVDRFDARDGLPAAWTLAADCPAPAGTAWTTVRSLLGTDPWTSLKPALKALAILNWRASSRFCGRCGAPAADKADEIARVCTACGSIVYPRLSPAILAVVTKGGRLLLARNANFKGGIFSLVAGFVEPAESFEECVVREVLEETGVEVGAPRYRASQGWPFPDSLMVGFEAEWISGEIRPDGVEIAEARWFSPDDPPPLPLPGSLSRALIDAAFGRIGGEPQAPFTMPAPS